MQLALDHNQTSVLAAIIVSYPKPYSACHLIQHGLPDFEVSKQAAIAAVFALQDKRLVRFKRAYLSLTCQGVAVMSDVIADTHSIH